jgi:hypothetical protein
MTFSGYFSEEPVPGSAAAREVGDAGQVQPVSDLIPRNQYSLCRVSGHGSVSLPIDVRGAPRQRDLAEQSTRRATVSIFRSALFSSGQSPSRLLLNIYSSFSENSLHPISSPCQILQCQQFLGVYSSPNYRTTTSALNIIFIAVKFWNNLLSTVPTKNSLSEIILARKLFVLFFKPSVSTLSVNNISSSWSVINCG